MIIHSLLVNFVCRDMNALQVGSRIASGRVELKSYIPQPNNFVPQLLQVMDWCLQVNPKDRPNMNQIIEFLENL